MVTASSSVVTRTASVAYMNTVTLMGANMTNLGAMTAVLSGIWEEPQDPQDPDSSGIPV